MTQKSEPMFNVPRVVIATIAVLVLVHVVRIFVLSDDQDVQFLLTFAFIPARYGTDLAVSGAFPGGFGADLWTFFTYAFIHADLMHLGLNLAWLVPFGTALARRFGAWRYTVFMLVMAAAGALAHLVTHLGRDGADDRRIGGDLGRDGGGDALCLSAGRPARAVAGWRRRCLSRSGRTAGHDAPRSAVFAVPRWSGSD